MLFSPNATSGPKLHLANAPPFWSIPLNSENKAFCTNCKLRMADEMNVQLRRLLVQHLLATFLQLERRDIARDQMFHQIILPKVFYGQTSYHIFSKYIYPERAILLPNKWATINLIHDWKTRPTATEICMTHWKMAAEAVKCIFVFVFHT